MYNIIIIFIILLLILNILFLKEKEYFETTTGPRIVADDEVNNIWKYDSEKSVYELVTTPTPTVPTTTTSKAPTTTTSKASTTKTPFKPRCYLTQCWSKKANANTECSDRNWLYYKLGASHGIRPKKWVDKPWGEKGYHCKGSWQNNRNTKRAGKDNACARAAGVRYICVETQGKNIRYY